MKMRNYFLLWLILLSTGSYIKASDNETLKKKENIPLYDYKEKVRTKTFSLNEIQQNLNSPQSLYLSGDPVQLSCLEQNTSYKGKVYARLKIGKNDYEYSEFNNTDFSISLELKVTKNLGTTELNPPVYTTISIQSSSTSTGQRYFKPEELILVFPEFMFMEGTTNIVDRIDFTVTNIASTGFNCCTTDVFLDIFYETEKVVLPKKSNGTPMLYIEYAANGNPNLMDEYYVGNSNLQPIKFFFNFYNDCIIDSIFHYQVQILKLYNNDENFKNDKLESKPLGLEYPRISAKVDWSKAVSFEIDTCYQYIDANYPGITNKFYFEYLLMEGSGWYTWRIRPIGNKYAGGIANDRNWGDWCDAITEIAPVVNLKYTDGQNIIYDKNSNNVIGAFYYSQGEKDKNWIHTKYFSEGNGNGMTFYDEIVHADNLLNERQSQKLYNTRDYSLVSETYYDYSGRSVINTLPVPYSNNSYELKAKDRKTGLDYKTGMLKNSANLPFNPSNYDSDINYNNPDASQNGLADNYYNGNASQEIIDAQGNYDIPSAEGYPYSKVLYSSDGSGRVIESSGFGATNRLAPDGLLGYSSKTQKVFYSSVSDNELTSVFGSEAPRANSVRKIITFDENQVPSIEYYDKNDKLLISCISSKQYKSKKVGEVWVDDNTLSNEDLGASTQDIIHYISGLESIGKNKYVATKRIFLEDQSNSINVNYRVDPLKITIGDLCNADDFCRTLEFNVELFLKQDNSTTNLLTGNFHTLPQVNGCTEVNNAVGWDPVNATPGHNDWELQLSRGTYNASRVLTLTKDINNELIEHVKNGLEGEIEQIYNDIIEYLDDIDESASTQNPLDMDDFYVMLAGKSYPNNKHWTYNSDKKRYELLTECCDTLFIPKYDCKRDCPGLKVNPGQPGEISFEEYLKQKWAQYVDPSIQSTFKLEDFFYELGNKIYSNRNGYTNGAGSFNTLISNMDNDIENLWSESSLCDCWSNIVDVYDINGFEKNEDGSIKYDNVDVTDKNRKPVINTKYNLLDDFLKCAGKKYKGFSESKDGSTGYLDNAHRYFYYAESGDINNDQCENNMGNWANRSTWQDDEYGFVDPSANNYITDKTWEIFRDCVYSGYDDLDVLVDDLQKDETKKEQIGDDDKKISDLLDKIKNGTDEEKRAEFLKLLKSIVDDCKEGCFNKKELIAETIKETLRNSRYYIEGDTYFKVWVDNNIEWVPVTPENILNHSEKLMTLKEIECYTLICVNICENRCELSTEIIDGVEKIVDNKGKVINGIDDSFVRTVSGIPIITDLTPCPRQLLLPQVPHYCCKPPKEEIVWDLDWDKEINIDKQNFKNKKQYYQGLISKLNYAIEQIYSELPPFKEYYTSQDMYIYSNYDRRKRNCEIIRNAIKSFDPSFPCIYCTMQQDDSEFNPPVSYLSTYECPDVDNQRRIFGLYDLVFVPIEVQIPHKGEVTGTYKKPVFLIDKNHIVLHVEGSLGQTDSKLVKLPIAENIGCNPTGRLCFDLAPPVAEENIVSKPVSCDNISGSIIRNYLTEQYEKCSDANIAEAFEKLDLAVNDALVNLDEEFKVFYSQPDYIQYTLYYYDRAGNLMKTVSPKGVVKDNSYTRLSATIHSFITRYHYGSTGNVLHQKFPDEGNPGELTGGTDFYYDMFLRPRFSRNPRQRQFWNNATLPDTLLYSYINYDYLGRIIETGEAGQIVGSGPEPEIWDKVNTGYLTANFGVFPPNDRKDSRIITIYDEYFNNEIQKSVPAPYPFIFDYRNNLLNRISKTARLDDLFGNPGNTDSVISYYSYDLHGNVDRYYSGVPMQELTLPSNMKNNLMLRKLIFKTAYEYDLISGKVKEVRFNEEKTDRYIQKYYYDEENRLVMVRTNDNKELLDRDASYEYYLTGPMKRIEIGEDSLQGIDYTYTINGWLKAINNAYSSPVPNYNDDPGVDGLYSPDPGNEKKYAADAFGMILGYNERDFIHSSNSGRFNSANSERLQNHITNLPPPDPPETVKPLYNGMISNVETFSFPAVPRTGYKYEYDLLYRLKKANSHESPGGAVWFKSLNDIYSSGYRYDKNGNFNSLVRHSMLTTDPMDDLSYNYFANSNRLQSVADAAPVNFTQPSNVDGREFEYDNSGNLSKDEIEGILKIVWTADGKVDSVIYSYETDNRTPKDYICFWYDAAGRRVKKLNRAYYNAEYHEIYTYYALDANGKIMAIYDKEMTHDGIPGIGPSWQSILMGNGYLGNVDNDFNPLASNTEVPDDPTHYTRRKVKIMGRDRYWPEMDGDDPFIELAGASSFEELLSMQFPKAGEFHFYGTEQDQRIGIMKSDKPVYYFSVDPERFDERFGRELRKKEYEIEDYLGNIRLVFSDMKLGNIPPSGDFQVDIISVLNYYPYGMLQPGRIIPIPDAGADGAAKFYRFGFNGMEADHDMKHDMNPVPGTKIGIGNSYTTEFRGNDPRLGKWWSMDPVIDASVSSYLAFGANPINFVDPRGDAKFIISQIYDRGSNEQYDELKNTYSNPNNQNYTLPSFKIIDDGINDKKIYITSIRILNQVLNRTDISMDNVQSIQFTNNDFNQLKESWGGVSYLSTSDAWGNAFDYVGPVQVLRNSRDDSFLRGGENAGVVIDNTFYYGGQSNNNAATTEIMTAINSYSFQIGTAFNPNGLMLVFHSHFLNAVSLGYSNIPSIPQDINGSISSTNFLNKGLTLNPTPIGVVMTADFIYLLSKDGIYVLNKSVFQSLGIDTEMDQNKIDQGKNYIEENNLKDE